MLAVLILNQMGKKSKSTSSTKKDLQSGKIPQTVCRCCLNTENLVSIFHSKEAEAALSIDLRLATGLEIQKDDGLPQKICKQCIETLNIVLRFRKTCKNTETALLQMTSCLTDKREEPEKRKENKAKSLKIKQEEVHETITIVPDDGLENEHDYSIDNHNVECKIEPIDEDYLEENPSTSNMQSLSQEDPIATAEGPSPYLCKICHQVFQVKETYDAHVRFHVHQFRCKECRKYFHTRIGLLQHKRARHGLSRIHKCSSCEYSSATKASLKIHERYHTGERPYVCDYCGASFRGRTNIIQHMDIHLPESKIQCPFCPKTMKSQRLLTLHFKAHRIKQFRHLCPSCFVTYRTPREVRAHLNRVHPLADGQAKIQRIQRVGHMFMCPSCPLTYAKPKDLSVHLRSDHAPSTGQGSAQENENGKDE